MHDASFDGCAVSYWHLLVETAADNRLVFVRVYLHLAVIHPRSMDCILSPSLRALLFDGNSIPYFTLSRNHLVRMVYL